MRAQTLTLISSLLTLSLPLGCGSKDSADTANSEADADVDADADADADVDECEDQREEIACGEVDTANTSASLQGRLVDESGAPYAGATVQLCSALQCKPAESDANGAFSYTDI